MLPEYLCSGCGKPFHMVSGFVYNEVYSKGLFILCRECNEDCKDLKAMLNEAFLKREKQIKGRENMKTLPINRKFGVEIETANTTSKITRFFKKQSDGSISGHEFVSPVLKGDRGVAIIKSELKSVIAECKADKRCGLHLHVDAKDMKWEQLKNAMYLYAHLEPLIYSMVTKDRLEGHWCLPVDSDKYKIESILNEDDLKRTFYKTLPSAKNLIRKSSGIMDKSGYDRRYSGFNLHAKYYLGTLELRYHEGTVSFNAIRNWIFLNLAIIDFAAKHKFDEVKKVCVSNPLITLADILREYYPLKTVKRLMLYVRDKIRSCN